MEIFGDLVNPSFLALSRNGERLYTVHGDCRDISAFRIAQSRVAINKSGANKVPIDAIMTGRDVQVLVRQVTCLTNIVEQDHRAIKRLIRPMLNFKSFRSANSMLAAPN